jgi:hypothetical protein
MLLSFRELKYLWKIHPNGVLHVGAHEAEESEAYTKYKWLPVTWIEAQPRLIDFLEKKLDPKVNTIIGAAIWNEPGLKKQLHITTNSQSTSLLKLGTHEENYPDIKVSEVIEVTTARLDGLINKGKFPSFLNLDIQGVELQALQSLGESIDEIDAIYTEVNKEEVYLNCANFEEIRNFLNVTGFEVATVRWVPGKGWGDALFLRTSNFKNIRLKRFVSKLLSLKFYSREYFSSFKASLKNK